MKKRKIYTGEFKAKVVIEFIKGKTTLESLSEKYNIHPNQIKNWKSLMLKRAHTIFDDRRKKQNMSEVK
jgi:transposase